MILVLIFVFVFDSHEDSVHLMQPYAAAQKLLACLCDPDPPSSEGRREARVHLSLPCKTQHHQHVPITRFEHVLLWTYCTRPVVPACSITVNLVFESSKYPHSVHNRTSPAMQTVQVYARLPVQRKPSCLPARTCLLLPRHFNRQAFPTMSQHAKSTAALRRIIASRDQPFSLAT